MRLIAAAALYFVIVFAAGFALGPVRVLWLEPKIGPLLAVLCETPFLLLAMAVGAKLAPWAAGFRGGWLGYLGVGAFALAFQQIADLAVGFGLRGMTLADQLAHFTTPEGAVYAFTLILFALAPLLLRGRAPSPAPPELGSTADTQ